MGTIRNYHDEIWLQFDQRGENFTLDVPHYTIWLQILAFLRKRGFKVGENPVYRKHYACLSKFHKYASKGDVVCLLEIHAAKIDLHFGHVKNSWGITGASSSFWARWHSNFKKLTYMEDLAVKLEIKRMMDFCGRYLLAPVKEEYNMLPEEFIINKLRINKHIHGDVTCLDDIRKDIMDRKSYDRDHNSTDRDGKFILSGTRKYFYDYRTGRIATGMAYHNINNMWWVICNKELRNICCSDLFDYSPVPKRRKPVTRKTIEYLLKKYETERNYNKCMQIKHYADECGIVLVDQKEMVA